MADEKIELTVTPEQITKSNKSLRRNSRGVPTTSGSGGKEKVLPIYLRASTSSCHDFCKYGRHHAFEEKGKDPVLIGTKSLPLKGQRPVKSFILEQRHKKRQIVKRRPSPESKIKVSSESQLLKRDPKPLKLETFALSPEPKTKVSNEPQSVKQDAKPPEQETSTPSAEPKTKASSVPQMLKRNATGPIQATSTPSSEPNAKAFKEPQLTKRDVKIPKQTISTSSPEPKTRVSSESLLLKRDTKLRKQVIPTISAEPKNTLSDEPQLLKGDAKLRKHENSSTPVETVVPKSVAALKSLPALAKSSVTLKPKPAAPKSSVSSFSPSTDKKVSRPPKASISPRSSVIKVAGLNARQSNLSLAKAKSPSRYKVRKADEPKLYIGDMVKEKMLYIVESKPEIKTPEFTDKGNCSISSPLSSCRTASSYEEEDLEDFEYTTLSEDNEILSFSEDDESVNKEEIPTTKTINKRGPAVIHPKDNDPARELKFRRGKVVNLQVENNGARRLKFRKGTGITDNHQATARNGRRNYSRQEISDLDLNGAKPESEQVNLIYLKHQDVQGKKDVQGLFNNVIEETASKLAETRKSKVLALVGAFETVISLQDKSTR